LLRQARTETGTALAQAAAGLRRKITKLAGEEGPAVATLDKGSDLLARNDLTGGAAQLRTLIDDLPLERLPEGARLVLTACAAQVSQIGAARLEYLLLILHTLHELPV